MYSEYKQVQNISRNQDQFVQKRPNKHKYYKEYYVNIDSRDRDRTLYPASNNFVVKFSSTASDSETNACIKLDLRNIYSVELVHAILPNGSSVTTNERLLYLDIEELGSGTIYGTNKNATNSTFILIPEYTHGASSAYSVSKYQLKTKRIFDKKLLDRLPKMTLRFLKTDGTLINFGTDATPPTDPTETVQVNVMLKITTVEYKLRINDI